ncbi:sugar phosphate isomerase/epimerase family protein [Devosia nitrariae]|uniref:Sugar phosphate isomerase n=1 Tax=Devosia nitrariae TaxID=2071872 RepID=A0ABQ5W5F3_9HYPH|nr:TIM barrel protein [Devosia nitrariae]GLQ55299.1 sugar phosphate isomerase [Devosia nitrariae]
MTLIHCFSTLGCPERSLKEAAGLAVKHGIGAVELRALSGSIDVPAKLAEEFGSPDGLADWLDGQPVVLAAFGTSARLFGETFDLAEIERFIPWAEAANVPNLRVFDGGEELTDADVAAGRERLDRWGDLRSKRGWTADLMIETHDALVAGEALYRFCREVPHARVLWDTHHTWAKGGTDPLATWSRIAPQVVHLHVKDSAPGPDGRAYVLPGEGDFPMAALRKRLDAEGVTMPMSLEWERMWHPHLPPLDAALSAASSNDWW